jgi:hypothetical protein
MLVVGWPPRLDGPKSDKKKNKRGAARPRPRAAAVKYGSLLVAESAVKPELASESIDDANEVVNSSSASLSSSAAVLAAARALQQLRAMGAQLRVGLRCSPSAACRHQLFATSDLHKHENLDM